MKEKKKKKLCRGGGKRRCMGNQNNRPTLIYFEQTLHFGYPLASNN